MSRHAWLYGQAWLSRYGYVWPRMAMARHGYVWPCMAIMARHGYVWPGLGSGRNPQTRRDKPLPFAAWEGMAAGRGVTDEVVIRYERVRFAAKSNLACRCHKALYENMHRVYWSWKGPCQGCGRHFGPGKPDGKCAFSTPKQLAGFSPRDDKELEEMMSDLGGASMLVYNEETEWIQGQESVCPRCQAVDRWVADWHSDLTRRLAHVAQHIVNGQAADSKQCLDELPQEQRQQEGAAEDLLFSHRLRSLVRELRSCLGHGGRGSPVAIMVPSGLTCHVLWRVLCWLQPVWFKGALEKPELGVTPNEMVKKMTQRPVGRPACARYHVGVMKQDELEQTAQAVNGLQIPVVVVCTDTKAKIPVGTFRSCTKVLCWNWHCGPSNGLLTMGSSLVWMEEDWDDHATSSSWSSKALQAGASGQQRQRRHPAAAASPEGAPQVAKASAVSATAATTALDNPDFTKIVRFVEKIWLQSAPDSYTVLAFRIAGVFMVEFNASKGYQVMVRSPGQLACLEPGLRSAWHKQPEDAKRDVAEKALKFFGKFDTGQEETVLSTVAAVAETIEQLTTLESDPLQQGPNVYGLKDPPRGGGQAQAQPCKTWADGRAKRDLEGARPPVIPSGEPQIHDFASLHDTDLSLPKPWPRIFCILRLEPTITADGELPPTKYGLLLAPLADGELPPISKFGLSLESDYGTVRFMPAQVDWWHQKKQMLTPTNPEELLREFHEIILHKNLLGIRPAAQVVERRSTSALLVKLESKNRSGDSVCFAWSDMQAVVKEQRKKDIDELVDNSLKNDEANVLVGEPNVAADEPPWLMSVLHRWYRLHDLEHAALKYMPAFPGLSPLMMEASLTMSSMPFEALRTLGSKVLGFLVAVTVHGRHPDKYHAQLARHIAELLPREKLATYLAVAVPGSMMSLAKAKPYIGHWAPPGARCHPLPASPQLEDKDLAHITEAFIGAYYLEGNFFSAHQFILWLQARGGEHDTSEAEKALLGHTGKTRYKKYAVFDVNLGLSCGVCGGFSPKSLLLAVRIARVLQPCDS